MSDTPPTSPARFDVNPYRADGGYSPAASAALIGSSMFAGAVLGAAASYMAQYIYLIVIFPAAIGGLLGMVNESVIQRWRIRSPLLGGVAGFFGGCVAMLAMHYGEYLQFRWKVPEEHALILNLLKDTEKTGRLTIVGDSTRGEKDEEVPIGEMPAHVRTAVRSYHSFYGFVDESAKAGVQLQRVGDGRGNNLGYAGSYIYWGLEVLLVAGIAFTVARKTAAEPFCTNCDRWKEHREMGALAPPAADAIDAVKRGDLAAVRPLGQGEEATESVQVRASVCGSCGAAAPVDVKLKHHFLDKKNVLIMRDAGFVTYPGAALPVLERLFPPAPEEAETPAAEAPTEQAGETPTAE